MQYEQECTNATCTKDNKLTYYLRKYKFMKTRDLVVVVALDSVPRADSKDSKDYAKL